MKVGRALRWPAFIILALAWALVELGRYWLLGPRPAPARDYITIAQVEEADDTEILVLAA